MNPYSKYASVWMIITALTVCFALALQLYILIDNTPGNGMTPLGAVDRFFIFFTVWTNTLVAICVTLVLLFRGTRPGKFFSRPFVQSAVALYIFIVGLVFNALLRGLIHLTGRARLADELLHVVVPVLFIIYWLFFVPKGTLKWRNLLPWMIYPAVYLAYSLLRGSYSGFYPYPFLNVANLGYRQVALNSAGVMLAFIVAGLLIIALDRSLGRRRLS